MSVQEYSLKITQSSKYTPFFVSNQRDEMSKFVTRVFDFFKQDYHLSMFHEDMNISRITVHGQSMEEFMIEVNNKDLQRSMTYESSKAKSKKRFYNYESPIMNKDKVFNANFQGEGGGDSLFERSGCANSGKKHLVKFLINMDSWFDVRILVIR